MNPSNLRELEVKVLVTSSPAVVAAQLDSVGAALTVPRVFERNVRYEDAAQSLTPRGMVLRLRQDNDIRLTYKAPGDRNALARGVHDRYEAEVSVSDFETMQAILGHLGYSPHMVYEKYRTTYVLDGAEVVLDELPYGNFVEIEAADEAHINRLLGSLNLADAPRIPQSYAGLFDIVRQALGLTFTDLTFANFENVSVPPAVLLSGIGNVGDAL